MTDNAPPGSSVTEPFPIFLVADRYMLYDVDVVSHIRRVYHMCGCLIGTLPQVPQQNVFLGLPLELMVEEATLLVKKGVAYIVDDVHSHKLGRATMLEEDKQTYLAQRDDKLRVLAEENQREALVRKMAALEKKGLSNLITRSGTPSSTREHSAVPAVEGDQYCETAHQETLFPQPNLSKKQTEETQLTFHSTSTTSNPVYHHIPKGPDEFLRIPTPNPNRFPIYQHLHSKGYFISPGIRFGAQYVAYPGDPLRFHSHFVVNGLGWDEEISVMDIVGGGRLGTGVKKAWMVGGKDPTRKEGDEGDGVRVFSVEWGGF